MTREEAVQLIEQERRERAEQCWKEVEATLQKHRCMLEAQVHIHGEKIESRVALVPVD